MNFEHEFTLTDLKIELSKAVFQYDPVAKHYLLHYLNSYYLLMNPTVPPRSKKKNSTSAVITVLYLPSEFTIVSPSDSIAEKNVFGLKLLTLNQPNASLVEGKVMLCLNKTGATASKMSPLANLAMQTGPLIITHVNDMDVRTKSPATIASLFTNGKQLQGVLRIKLRHYPNLLLQTLALTSGISQRTRKRRKKSTIAPGSSASNAINICTSTNTNTTPAPEAKESNDVIEIMESSDEDNESKKEDDEVVNFSEAKSTTSDQADLSLLVPPSLSKGDVVQTPYGIGQILNYKKERDSGIYHYVIKFETAIGYIQSTKVTSISNNVVSHYDGRRGKIVFTQKDVGRLSEGEYLNDSIIEFYTDQLQNSSSNIYIFSTFFFNHFTSLVTQRHSDKKREEKFKAAYNDIASWTKGINIFEKKYLFIPVNDNLHWSLLVVCYPNLLFKQRSVLCTECDDVEKCKCTVPFILMLDSMKCHRTQTVASYVRKYLEEAYNASETRVMINASVLPAISPKFIPRQDNNCDCGVFLLEYLERMLLNEDSIINTSFVKSRGNYANAVFSKEWFTKADISRKRKMIKEMIFTCGDGSL